MAASVAETWRRRDGLTAVTWWNVDRTHEPRLTVGATPLVERCIRIHGWSEEFALKVLAGYRQFLGWKNIFEDFHANKLSPSIAVDQMWHQHILDNRNFAEDCQLLFGKIIFHDPDGGLDVEAHRKRIANTKNALCMQYGEDYDREVWNFGIPDDEGTRRGTKRAHSPESTGSRTVSPVLDEFVQPLESDECVRIIVHSQSGSETYFKVKKTTRMERIFETYAQRLGVQCSSLKFMLDGERICPLATPQMLELADMDKIDVILIQTGC
jgi:small ubiquitin-related modifier